MEIDISLPNKIYRGNTIDISCHLNIDLSNYIIRAEVFDRFYSSLKLSSEVIGEIEIVDEEDGTFIIHVPKDSTNLFHLISYIEIDVEDDDGNDQTVWFSVIRFEDTIYMRTV